jgi:hypothetical protein
MQPTAPNRDHCPGISISTRLVYFDFLLVEFTHEPSQEYFTFAVTFLESLQSYNFPYHQFPKKPA